jgi:type IV secretory pathway TrbF-like protein
MMLGFGKKNGANGKADDFSELVREEEGLPPSDPDAPWVLAQRHHDDRFLRLAAHARNWQRFAMFSLLVAAGAVGGVVYIGSQSKIIPYLIEVDKLGRTIAVRAVTGRDAVIDPKRLVYRELIEFIENARTVTVDYGANNTFMNRAFSRLSGTAYDYVKQELIARKPNEVAQSRTIAILVHTALPVTDNTWQVEWTETSYNFKGESIGDPERWKANMHFELRPGGEERDLARNPTGFVITSLSWTKQM